MKYSAGPALASLLLLATPAAAFDRTSWEADYVQLRDAATRLYVNLPDKVTRQGLDPQALDRKIRTELAQATTDADGLRALVRFLGAFQDPHVRIVNLAEARTRFAPVRYVYPVHLRLLRGDVVVDETPGGTCELAKGTRVRQIAGQPVVDGLKPYEELVPSGNPETRRAEALQVLTASVFAPRTELAVSGVDTRRRPAVCRFLPETTPVTAPPAPTPVTPELTGEAACRALGVKDALPGLPPTLLADPRFKLLTPEGASFPAGTLTLERGPAVGVLRVPAFGAQGYAKACAETWESYRKTLHGTCDDDCRHDFLRRHVEPRLLAEAKTTVEALAASKAGLLLVDVTGNGGGNDWYDNVARMLAAQPGLKCQEVRRLRHPSTVASYESLLAALKRDADDRKIAPADRKRVHEAMSRLTKLIHDAKGQCDLSPAWTTPRWRPTCSLVTEAHEYACGQFPALPPDALAGVRERQPLFKPLDQGFAESLYKGRLAILVDRDTASSAEAFASELREGAGAKLLGEPTASAGCGVINGGAPVTLAHSGLVVQFPNCIRYDKDGRNEALGLTPDVYLPWRGDDPTKASQALKDALLRLAGEPGG